MFRDQLKYLRKQRSITQEQLATIVGVERSSVGKWEGKGNIIPSPEILDKLANYFGVTIDYLLGRTEETQEHIQATGMPALDGYTQEIIELSDRLNDTGKKKTIAYMHDLSENPTNLANPQVHTLKIAARGPVSHDVTLTKEEMEAFNKKYPQFAPNEPKEF